jgi:hypothetical protein
MGFEMNAVRGRKPADDQAIAQENQKTEIGSMTKAARKLGANREKDKIQPAICMIRSDSDL